MEKKNFNEEWRQIEDNPYYYVSNLGRIYSVKLNRLLEGYISKKRKRMTLNSKYYLVNRIVAKAFPEICGKWFDGCEIHHLDFNPLNDRADNLMVCTRKEHDAYHYGDRVEINKKRSGINHPNYGKPLLEETKRKISEVQKGKKLSEETKRKISEAKKGKHHSEETCRKMSEAKKGIKFTETHIENIRKSHKLEMKPVYQYTLDGKFIREFESMREVKRELGYDNSKIGRCCHGKQKSHHGFLWSFANQDKPD